MPSNEAAETIDEYRLEEIAQHHPIGAAVFLPFAMARLRSDRDPAGATLRVSVRGSGEEGVQERLCRLVWSPESRAPGLPAVQDRVVTEWAACGVACAVVHLYGGLRVRSVAAEGDGL